MSFLEEVEERLGCTLSKPCISFTALKFVELGGCCYQRKEVKLTGSTQPEGITPSKLRTSFTTVFISSGKSLKAT
jgi:hypothetical protein